MHAEMRCCALRDRWCLKDLRHLLLPASWLRLQSTANVVVWMHGVQFEAVPLDDSEDCRDGLQC